MRSVSTPTLNKSRRTFSTLWHPTPDYGCNPLSIKGDLRTAYSQVCALEPPDQGGVEYQLHAGFPRPPMAPVAIPPPAHPPQPVRLADVPGLRGARVTWFW